MKVGVDASRMDSAGRGMGRFASQLIGGLHDKAILLKPGPGRHPSFPVWEQFHLMPKAKRAESDYLLCPYNTAPFLLSAQLPTIVVIHDLIFMNPEIGTSVSRTQNIGRWYRRTIVPIAARQASQIITVSEYSRRIVCDRFMLDPAKVSVIPNWIEESWFQKPAPSPDAPYLLTVSGEAPSKNLARLLDAFAAYRNGGGKATLKIVGVKTAWHKHFSRIAQEHGILSAVELLPFVSDDALRALYRGAAAFVCASLAEGFGIPVLEAMASGVPLASSSATSLPEVAGEAACYFDPQNTPAITEALSEVLSNSSASKARVAKGLARAWEFRSEAIKPRIEAFWSRLESTRG